MAGTDLGQQAPKAILVFLDGTRNKPSDARVRRDTNVWKLYQAAKAREGQQPVLAKYVRGVGTSFDERVDALVNDLRPFALKPWRQRLGPVRRGMRYLLNASTQLRLGYCDSAVGWGVSDRVREAYTYVSQHYEPGDEIYLFGFSRGAFEARSLAGFISEVGLLLKDRATSAYHQRWVDLAYALYVRQSEAPTGMPWNRQRQALQLPHLLRRLSNGRSANPESAKMALHFLGVWDTVDAVRLDCVPTISSGLLGTNRLTLRKRIKLGSGHHLAGRLPQEVGHARHALAMHELRAAFEPLLITPSSADQDVRQIWFTGAHADVGGGYPGPDETVLSDIALRWMADEALQVSQLAPPSLPLKFCGLPDSSSRILPQLPHYATQGDFGWATPTIRRDWTGWEKLPLEIVATFDLHESAVDRVADAASCTYTSYPYEKDYRWTRWLPGGRQYPPAVAAELARADEVAKKLRTWSREALLGGDGGLAPLERLSRWGITTFASAQAARSRLAAGRLFTADGAVDINGVQAALVASLIVDGRNHAKALADEIRVIWCRKLDAALHGKEPFKSVSEICGPWMDALRGLGDIGPSVLSALAKAVRLDLELTLRKR